MPFLLLANKLTRNCSHPSAWPSSSLQRVVDKDGKVISQLCDDEGNLGHEEFEKAMRKQANTDRVLVG